MIPLFKPNIPKNLGVTLQKVFDSGMLTEGALSDEFEEKFSKLIDNPYTALTNSCTSALTLAYKLCDVQQGDVVITTPMTCMATNVPLHNLGAKLAWADVSKQTGNISCRSVEELLKKHKGKVKAVVCVHWAGEPVCLSGLKEICGKANVPLVADAAHALCAKYKGVDISHWADYTCYSFQAIKHLTTIDGGALACRNKLDFEKVKLLRWFGLDRKYPGSKWEQDISLAGYKFHMNNVNAAVGLEQLKNINMILSRHVNNANRYRRELKTEYQVRRSKEFGTRSADWLFTIHVEDPKAFKTFMNERDIQVDQVHMRNDKYTVFRSHCKGNDSLPGVSAFCAHMTNIPVGAHLSDDDVTRVIEAVNAYSQ